MLSLSRIAKSALVASLVPATIFSVIEIIFSFDVSWWSLSTVVAAWLGGLAIICLFGVPVFLWLNHIKSLRWLTVSSAGFIVGFLSPVIIGLANHSSDTSYSSGGSLFGIHVDFVINGELTIYGWLRELHIGIFFGLVGAASSLAFWRVWLLVGPNK